MVNWKINKVTLLNIGLRLFHMVLVIKGFLVVKSFNCSFEHTCLFLQIKSTTDSVNPLMSLVTLMGVSWYMLQTVSCSQTVGRPLIV